MIRCGTRVGLKVESKDESLARQLLECFDVIFDEGFPEAIGELIDPEVSGTFEGNILLDTELRLWHGDKYIREEDEDDDYEEDDDEPVIDFQVDDLFYLANMLFAPAYVYIIHVDENHLHGHFFRYETVLDPMKKKKTEFCCYYDYDEGINVDSNNPIEESTESREEAIVEKMLERSIVDHFIEIAESMQLKELVVRLKDISRNAVVKIEEKKTITNPLFKVKEGKLIKYLGNEKVVIIPEGIISIAREAFFGHEITEEVIIPKGVTAIRGHAFSGLSALKKVSLPNGLLSIGKGAFSDCKSLTHIAIPESVTRIGESAFCGCTSLTRIVIPDGVTQIAEYVFFECHNLTYVHIPKIITDIGKNAFCECEKLTEFNWPQNITVINEAVFLNSGLSHIIIPDTVIRIERCAFEWCALKEIAIPDSVVYIDERAFTGNMNLAVTVSKGGYAEKYCKQCKLMEKIIKKVPFNEFAELFKIISPYFDDRDYKYRVLNNLMFPIVKQVEPGIDAFATEPNKFFECLNWLVYNTLDKEGYNYAIAKINELRKEVDCDCEEVEGDATKARYIINKTD